MDEQEFKNAYRSVKQEICPFQKAIVKGSFACSLSRKILIAEREAVVCEQHHEREYCRDVLQKLKEKSVFALKLVDTTKSLPNNKELQLQCGGLSGINALVNKNNQPADIVSLMRELQDRYSTLDNLPYFSLVRFISHYQVRNKSARDGR